MDDPWWGDDASFDQTYAERAAGPASARRIVDQRAARGQVDRDARLRTKSEHDLVVDGLRTSHVVGDDVIEVDEIAQRGEGHASPGDEGR